MNYRCMTFYHMMLSNLFLLLFCFLQPNFGASLHILKVEIGGDAQTTGNASLSIFLSRSKFRLFKGIVHPKNKNSLIVYLPFSCSKTKCLNVVVSLITKRDIYENVRIHTVLGHY